MATKMAFGAEKCLGATSETTGRSYDADKKGFITVEDPRDVAALKAGGYSVVGGMPRLRKYWVCEPCGWESAINHCRYCDSDDLSRVER